MGVVIHDLSDQHWHKVRPAADYAVSGYPARIPTVSQPTGDGVIPVGHQGAVSSKKLLFIPIGTGSASNTFGMQVLGWRDTALNVNTARQIWIPVALATYAVTLGSETGIANSDLLSTYFLATTITCSYGPTFITAQLPTILDWSVYSPGGNAVGLIIQPAFGFRLIEVIFTTGGSAAGCNALWCRG